MNESAKLCFVFEKEGAPAHNTRFGLTETTTLEDIACYAKKATSPTRCAVTGYKLVDPRNVECNAAQLIDAARAFYARPGLRTALNVPGYLEYRNGQYNFKLFVSACASEPGTETVTNHAAGRAPPPSPKPSPKAPVLPMVPKVRTSAGSRHQLMLTAFPGFAADALAFR